MVVASGGGLHHAQPGRASGFCIYNDITMPPLLAKEYNQRVLIIDTDSHGDGTQWSFYADNHVTILSMKPENFFSQALVAAERGEDIGYGHTVECTLKNRCTEDASFWSVLN